MLNSKIRLRIPIGKNLVELIGTATVTPDGVVVDFSDSPQVFTPATIPTPTSLQEGLVIKPIAEELVVPLTPSPKRKRIQYTEDGRRVIQSRVPKLQADPEPLPDGDWDEEDEEEEARYAESMRRVTFAPNNM